MLLHLYRKRQEGSRQQLVTGAGTASPLSGRVTSRPSSYPGQPDAAPVSGAVKPTLLYRTQIKTYNTETSYQKLENRCTTIKLKQRASAFGFAMC